jgi:hypothetical protein
MKLDLEALRIRHALLPLEHASDLGLHAAVALARWHTPGVEMKATVMLDHHSPVLSWSVRSADEAAQLDVNRVTELGAEAIALSLVHATRGWVVRRRLQRAEFADWLLADANGGHVALEVSGTDDGDARGRMREKLQQVSGCVAAPLRVACVVRFVDPVASVEQSP